MYSDAFEKAVNHCMLYEVGGQWNINTPGAKDGLIDTPEHRKACGYTNTVGDRGGETKYGIAKKSHTEIDVTHLAWDTAKAVYFANYWLNAKCDKLNGHLAALHFDGAVQHGPSTAAKFIQRAAGITADGVIGPNSLSIINSKDVFSICNDVCDQREKFYKNIVDQDPSQQKFLAGWLRRVTEMRAFVTNKAQTF
jgi:lysozyme family protein